MDQVRPPNQNRLRPLYGKFGWAYDLVVPRPAGGSAKDVARNLVSLGVEKNSLVIDAGCGTGRYSQELAVQGLRVIGVDRSDALIKQARTRTQDAMFECADLFAWRPPELATGVLCRGVLNEFTVDSERRSIFGAFGSWLRLDGVLLADVRDWEATATRYASKPRHQLSISQDKRTLDFSSETTLDSESHLMRVRECYFGTIDGNTIEETYDLEMRCWTAEEVCRCVADAGFTQLELHVGAEAGVTEDRLLVVARK